MPVSRSIDQIRNDEIMEILALVELSLPQFKTSSNTEEVAKTLGRRIMARMPNPMLAHAYKRVFAEKPPAQEKGCSGPSRHLADPFSGL